MTMTRRFFDTRRIGTALLAAGIAAGALGSGFGTPARAEVSTRVRAQQAGPPPAGSGVTVIVVEPEPLGPRSFT
jgi:hypothetical protein